MGMKVGSVVVPRASIAVNRNYDYDFQTGQSTEPPYRYSKPVSEWSALGASGSLDVLMCSFLGPSRQGAPCRGKQEAIDAVLVL